jgi:hypothetical protein
LQFNIIPLTMQTDNGKSPDRREGKGAMNWDHKARKIDSIHQPTKNTLYQKRAGFLNEENLALRCVCHSKTNKKKSEIQVSRMQIWVACLPMFRGISHQNAFLRTNWQTLNWKSRTMRCVNTVLTATIFLIHILLIS